MKTKTIIALTILGGALVAIAVKRQQAATTPQYFTLKDISSRGTPPPPELEENALRLLKNLNVIQDELYKISPTYKITITSSYRTPEHNASIGGAKNSKHMQAQAVDFQVQGMQPKDVQNLIIDLVNAGKIDNAGLGRGKTFTHYNYRTDGKNSSWEYVGDGGSNTYSTDFVKKRQSLNVQNISFSQEIPIGNNEDKDI